MRKPGQSNRPHQAALVMIGLGVASRIARDARTHEAVIMVAVLVAVAVAVARSSEEKSRARLAAWDRKQATRAVHKVKSATKATVQAIQPGTD
jgi:hypothetical protein